MTQTCTAFDGLTRIATGDVLTVARAVKATLEAHPAACVLIFDDITSQLVELDLRGSLEDVLQRLTPPPPAPAMPGRPKLGVVAREVTLLPRHWEWLAQQPGGASVALRKLVEEARRGNSEKDQHRQRLEAAYRFLSAMAGNLPGFEAATRALFANDAAGFAMQITAWPPDIREHALKLAAV
jgi:hypothetical protein